MRAYCVYARPGLGFDERVFEKLKLNGIKFEYLNPIEPLKNERIESYANRISKRIEENSKDVVLIGHSFGGIIAQEIAKIRPIQKIILVSSIKSRKELPFHFKIVKPLQLHHFFSKKLTAKTIKYWGKYHDYATPEEQTLVKDMVTKHSNFYLQWALRQLSLWQTPKPDLETKIFQIHGETDKTFPIKLINRPNKRIPKAGHFMVFKQAALINEVIETELKNKNGMQNRV